MAKTPSPKKTVKPKKAPAKKAAPAEMVDAAAVPKKPRAKKEAAKAEANGVHVAMHGETRIHHAGDDASAGAIAMIGGIVDAVHAAGRVRITSAAHAGGATTLHAVLPDHPLPYERHPGVILCIGDAGQVAFDHVEIGTMTPALVEDAAHSILVAMAGNDPDAMSRRRVDWFEQAVNAAEDVAGRHAAS